MLWLVRVILIWWIATSGSMSVFLVSLKAITVGLPPDPLIPLQEQTTVNQNQEWVKQSSAATATTSSSKSYEDSYTKMIIVCLTSVAQW